LPSWLWILVHKRPPRADAAGEARPADHMEEDRRHCPRCSVETWHVERTYSNGERTVECESCGSLLREHVTD
jgi:hypothetical protein